MLISYKKKFIFVHIDKNGGTSIRNSLEKYSDSKILFLISNKIDKVLRFNFDNKEILYGRSILNFLNRFLKINNNFFSYHHPLSLLNMVDLNKYFKFCVFRNPVDRFYSLYFHNLYHKHSSGHIYAKKGISNFLNNFIIKNKIKRQVDYIISKNKKIIINDFILFDRIEKDYERICKKIIGKKIKLSHLNKKKIKKKEKLNSKDLNNLKKYFKEDIKIYNLLIKNVNPI